MEYRKVKQLLFAQEIEMGGIPVYQPFPTNNVEQIDPFLLLHHLETNVKANSHPRETGVDPHPHRGFSPITFVIKGNIHHRDSRGNSQLVQAGGVQWLDAGRGIVHSERAGTNLAESGGQLELIQLWINTPQIHKMDTPRYLAFEQDKIPKIESDNQKVISHIISGEFEGVKGAIHAKSPMLILQIRFVNGAHQTFDIPESYNLLIYVISGKIKVQDFGLVEAKHAIYFDNNSSSVDITALSDANILLLAGEPIKEPVVSQGPFVMNTQTEIMTAMRDYQLGRMGVLIEDF